MSSTLAMSMSYIQPSAVTHSKQDAFQLAYPNTVPTKGDGDTVQQLRPTGDWLSFRQSLEDVY